MKTRNIRAITLILCLLLTACDTGAMHRMHTCRQEAGPEPMAGASVFGVVGLLVAHQDPERRAWDDRVNACFREAMR